MQTGSQFGLDWAHDRVTRLASLFLPFSVALPSPPPPVVIVNWHDQQHQQLIRQVFPAACLPDNSISTHTHTHIHTGRDRQACKPGLHLTTKSHGKHARALLSLSARLLLLLLPSSRASLISFRGSFACLLPVLIADDAAQSQLGPAAG